MLLGGEIKWEFVEAKALIHSETVSISPAVRFLFPVVNEFSHRGCSALCAVLPSGRGWWAKIGRPLSDYDMHQCTRLPCVHHACVCSVTHTHTRVHEGWLEKMMHKRVYRGWQNGHFAQEGGKTESLVSQSGHGAHNRGAKKSVERTVWGAKTERNHAEGGRGMLQGRQDSKRNHVGERNNKK